VVGRKPRSENPVQRRRAAQQRYRARRRRARQPGARHLPASGPYRARVRSPHRPREQEPARLPAEQSRQVQDRGTRSTRVDTHLPRCSPGSRLHCAPRSPRSPRTLTTPPSSGAFDPARRFRVVGRWRERQARHRTGSHAATPSAPFRAWCLRILAQRATVPPRRLPGPGQVDRTGGTRRQARGHRRRSAADLREDRRHPSGVAAAGQGLRNPLGPRNRSSRACRACMRTRWAARGVAAGELGR